MGDYSKSYTYKEMVKMGFVKPQDVPEKYKGLSPKNNVPYRFYFRYYDIGSQYGTAYLNIGDNALLKEGLKIYSSPGEMYKRSLRLIRSY